MKKAGPTKGPANMLTLGERAICVSRASFCEEAKTGFNWDKKPVISMEV